MSTPVSQLSLGAVPLVGGGTAFRVWAPAAADVAVRVRGEEHELAAAGEGVFAAEVDARPGDDYL
jgi:1,4-alpha-glucan branching enzyme